jgi:hypothetical protein
MKTLNSLIISIVIASASGCSYDTSSFQREQAQQPDSGTEIDTTPATGTGGQVMGSGHTGGSTSTSSTTSTDTGTGGQLPPDTGTGGSTGTGGTPGTGGTTVVVTTPDAGTPDTLITVTPDSGTPDTLIVTPPDSGTPDTTVVVTATPICMNAAPYSPPACNTIDFAAKCNEVVGCTWVADPKAYGTCQGTATPCAMLTSDQCGKLTPSFTSPYCRKAYSVPMVCVPSTKSLGCSNSAYCQKDEVDSCRTRGCDVVTSTSTSTTTSTSVSTGTMTGC